MLTAHDCLELGIVDQVVPEPYDGAHTNQRGASLILQAALIKQLNELSKLSQSRLLKRRYQKFRRMGEQSKYSQEAMNYEVELLKGISSGERGSQSGRPWRKKKASRREPRDAAVSTVD